MEVKDCQMHMRVCKIYDYTPFGKGRIIGPPKLISAPNKYVVPVEWDSPKGRGAFDNRQSDEQLHLLVPEEEGLRQEARLRAVEVQMEQEFERLREAIRSKMTSAVALIQEAGQMAQGSNRNLYEDLYMESRDIINALKEHGWSSSSFSC